ncbi:chitinase [Duganella sp. FT80W]|uniref:chitinase n=1 Tax=Duganella guangzhouensis TaxID=2666084 RepID=A0A6I2L3M6_9BURK|nr:glycoside hydrolase family 18 protein [Duganella guangzhouensis]MRW91206.1 chitinase [Duganella guangzhouensis]
MRANFLMAAALAAALPAGATEVVGYYPGWKHQSYPVSSVDASKLTMALYAFVDLCWDGKHGNADPSVNKVEPCQDARNGALAWRNEAEDGANLRALVALKRQHPQFKVVISVGGWDWSNRFSNVAASAPARANFIASSLQTMRRYGLDGVDLDWEFPGEVGVPCVAGEVCARPEDRQNFITWARELRTAFDAAGKQDGKRYSITIAAGGNASYTGDGVWVKQLAQSLDWINLMAYDYHAPWEKSSNHHAALYDDVTGSVQRYLHAGVAPQQLVLGVPFYGYGWKGCPPGPNGDGLRQPCESGVTDGVNGSNSYSYGMVLQRGDGYRRYRDAAAHAPYMYNAAERVWIAYEDPQSLREKAAYIKQQGLRGAMFWELSVDDERRQMLNTLSEAMRP